MRSWPGIFSGHAVVEGQELVTSGAYGLVRHPVYLAAIVVVWVGLSLAYLSLAAALVTMAYVVPAYLLYVRSEEAMMEQEFGGSYRRYRERVPGLVPRLRRGTHPRAAAR